MILFNNLLLLEENEAEENEENNEEEKKEADAEEKENKTDKESIKNNDEKEEKEENKNINNIKIIGNIDEKMKDYEKKQILNLNFHKILEIFKEYEKEIKYYILGIFLFFIYFCFNENNFISLVIVFLIQNIWLYFFNVSCEYGNYIICFCYFLLSLSINCFRIKYFIPFLAAAISRYLVFINIFLIIDFNLYSFLFIFN